MKKFVKSLFGILHDWETLPLATRWYIISAYLGWLIIGLVPLLCKVDERLDDFQMRASLCRGIGIFMLAILVLFTLGNVVYCLWAYHQEEE